MALPNPNPKTVHDFDIGQIAVFDSCIEVLPNNTDSRIFVDKKSISRVLRRFQHELDGDLIEEVGGKLVQEDTNGEPQVSHDIEGIAYAIKCGSPDTERLFKKKAKRVLNQQDIPSWAWAAYHEPTRIYVGGTHRPDERIQEHLGRSYEYEGAVFTEIFEPIKIKTILLSLGESPYKLEQLEARSWQDFPATFVFQA